MILVSIVTVPFGAILSRHHWCRLSHPGEWPEYIPWPNGYTAQGPILAKNRFIRSSLSKFWPYRLGNLALDILVKIYYL
jgi:hypothetical protein